MIPVADYCRALDTHYIKQFDFFNHFKKNGQLLTDITTEMDLIGIEKKEFKRLCKEYKDNLYSNEWRKILTRHLDYRDVQPLGDHKESID